MKAQFSLRMLLLLTAIVAAGFYYYHKKQNEFVHQSGSSGFIRCNSGEFSFYTTYKTRNNGELFLLPLLLVKEPDLSPGIQRRSPGISIHTDEDSIRMFAFGHEIPMREGSVVYFDEQLKMYVLRDVKYTQEMIRKFETLPNWLRTIAENLSKYHDEL